MKKIILIIIISIIATIILVLNHIERKDNVNEFIICFFFLKLNLHIFKKRLR